MQPITKLCPGEVEEGVVAQILDQYLCQRNRFISIHKTLFRAAAGGQLRFHETVVNNKKTIWTDERVKMEASTHQGLYRIFITEK